MSESNDTETQDRDDQIREAFDELEAQQDAADESEAPDPSSLEPITKEEAEYARDAEGNLKPNSHAVQYNGDWRRIDVRPPLPTEAADMEQKFQGRADLELEDLYPLLDDHIAEPADVDWQYAKPQVFMPSLMALIKEFTGGAEDEFFEEVEDELEKRSDGSEGN